MSEDIVRSESDAIHNVSRGLIELVREGMTVVDAAGDKVGKVELMEMGDPQAVSLEGNELPEPNFIGELAMAFAGDDEREPDVPDPMRSRLRRVGYLKVDGGFFGDDRYVSADKIARVENDTVFLSVRKDRLIEEDEGEVV